MASVPSLKTISHDWLETIRGSCRWVRTSDSVSYTRVSVAVVVRARVSCLVVSVTVCLCLCPCSAVIPPPVVSFKNSVAV